MIWFLQNCVWNFLIMLLMPIWDLINVVDKSSVYAQAWSEQNSRKWAGSADSWRAKRALRETQWPTWWCKALQSMTSHKVTSLNQSTSIYLISFVRMQATEVRNPQKMLNLLYLLSNSNTKGRNNAQTTACPCLGGFCKISYRKRPQNSFKNPQCCF